MCLSTDPKYFWTSPKNFDIDQIVFESNPKQFRQIQNHLGPVEGQSNSCVMYVMFFILTFSTLIKFDFNQCCVS